MAIVFPASPSVNDTFTAGSITYKWDGDKWIGLGVTPADRLVEGSNKLEIDASNNLVWTGGSTSLNNTVITDQLSIGSGSSANSEYGLIAYSNSGSTSNYSAVYARNLNSNGRVFTGDDQNGATRFEVFTDGRIISTLANATQANPLTLQNSTSGGNTQVLIKAFANGGGDAFIKFDCGGSDMIVGNLYAGTTNNKLVLGPGGSASAVAGGIEIDGNGRLNSIAFNSGSGIDFSPSGIEAAGVITNTNQLLDDYEEGLFSPDLVGSSGGIASGYNHRKGGYVKIGNLVHVYGYLSVNNLGSITGNVRLAGFPFPTKNDATYYHAPACGWYTGMTGITAYGVGLDMAPGQTNHAIVYGNGTGVTALPIGNITTNFGIEWALTYRTS